MGIAHYGVSSSAFRDVLARAMLEIRSFLSGSASYRRFVIVGIARTGSTLLIDLLNSHSQALAFGELFRSSDAIGWDVRPFTTLQNGRLLTLYQSDPLTFLQRNVFRSWPREIAAVGFKLFYYHARVHPYSAIWDYLSMETDVRILHIKRRNILEQFLSLQRAHLSNIWSSTQLSKEITPPLRLEAEACKMHFSRVRRFEAECDTFFARHLVKSVYYEDLIARRAAEMQDVFDFLGLRKEPVSAQIVRQRTEPLASVIANYGELKEFFVNTEWAEFFRGHDT
jgi:LPS sulfotransferase NodH